MAMSCHADGQVAKSRKNGHKNPAVRSIPGRRYNHHFGWLYLVEGISFAAIKIGWISYYRLINSMIHSRPTLC